MKKLAIGITGGIGSGKSTVSSIFEENGFPVLKADLIAKEVMIKDLQIISKISELFGKEAYEEGKLNTKFLANKVFSDHDQIKILNSIVHPKTIEKISQLISENLKSQNLVFVESALIYEAKMEKLFDYILMISASEDNRILRVIKRDNETSQEIKSRIMNQLTDKEKLGRADFTIENDGNFEDLKSKSLFFLKLFQNL